MFELCVGYNKKLAVANSTCYICYVFAIGHTINIIIIIILYWYTSDVVTEITESIIFAIIKQYL